MGHPNEDLIRKVYDAFNKGDFDAVTKSFATDIVGHVPGRSRLAGDYKGVEEIMGLFGKLVEAAGPNYSVDIHDVLANDDHVAVLGKVKADKDGDVHEANSIEIYHVKDGKITEFWTLEDDQYKADAFYG